MTPRRIVLLVTCVWVVFPGSAQTRANVVFDTLGSLNRYDPDGSRIVTYYPDDPTCNCLSDTDAAVAFTLTGDDCRLNRVDVALSLSLGNNKVDILVMNDAAGKPGSVIETIHLEGVLSSDPGVNPPVLAVSQSNPNLVSGRQYWIGVSTPGPDLTIVDWHDNTVGYEGRWAHRTLRDGLGDWGTWSSGYPCGAMRVICFAPAKTIYVDASAAVGGNGLTWATAYKYLQDALAEAAGSDQIWVAGGIYRPTCEFNPGDPRSACFQMRHGVEIYGGFAGNETAISERDFLRIPTILSGDIGTPGAEQDNCYHVLYHPEGFGLGTSAVLDGFTIAGGNASSGTAEHGKGGGMANYDSSPTVRNCIFRDNMANSLGGGMYNDGENSGPVVIDCTFVGNYATNGGGLVNTERCSTYVYGCTFQDNHAGVNGGAVYSGWEPATFINCRFIGNHATKGGAIADSSYATAMVAGCLFWQNSAEDGGALYYDWGDFSLTNCTFVENTADTDSGVIHMYSNSEPSLEITNSIIWDNQPNTILTLGNPSLVTVDFSDVQGGHAGFGNIDDDPLFQDPGSGDFYIRTDSPCIDAGYNWALPAEVLTDIAGNERIVDGDGDDEAVIDMGAYEGPLREPIPGDSNGDGKVDFTDLAIVGSHWLEGAE